MKTPSKTNYAASSPKFTVCWLCTQTVRMRADGQMAKHREPRSHAGKYGPLAVCPQSYRVPT